MNCPICNQPAKEVTLSASIKIDGKNWVYEYRKWSCYRHRRFAFQDEKQLQDNLDAINAAMSAAAIIKKHQ